MRKCDCGSGLERFMVCDGYNIFLFYGCDKCRERKLRRFRSDIMEQYQCDEPIEPE